MQTGIGGVGLLAAGSRLLNAQSSPVLAKFVDPLPIPTHLPHSDFYHITMNQVMAKLHRDLPPTPVWAYSGNFIGVLIEAFRGHPTTVRWDNQLPSTHLIPEAIDLTIHGSTPDIPQVKTVVHLHGMKVLPQFDGYPESWFTNSHINVNPPNYRDYHYPNDQPATNLWFHDHAIGTTRTNFYAGLVGDYFIRDNFELSLGNQGLPINPPFEVPLIFMDRWFTIGANNQFTGTMLYPTPTTPPPAFNTSAATPHHPVWATELWADTALVNGKVYPFLDVQPRLYRFRTLNACNARFLNISFHDETANKDLPFLLIGTDQGFLQRPVQLRSVLKGNAERHDILVNFEDLEGHVITMKNLLNGVSTPAPFPSGGGGPDLPDIMQFRVGREESESIISIPSTLASIRAGLTTGPSTAAASSSSAVFVRDVPLDEIEDTQMDELRDPNFGPDPPEFEGANETGAPVLGTLELKHWAAPITIFPTVGSTEIWRFINATPDTHPIHVHLVEFQVLDRQQYNVDKFKATRMVDFTDPTTGMPFPVMGPDPDEVNAPKDVVRASMGMVTRIKMTFNLPTGTVTTSGEHFKYVVHCHILEHEDNEMMRPWEAVAP
jgi:spore coat protein A